MSPSLSFIRWLFNAGSFKNLLERYPASGMLTDDSLVDRRRAADNPLMQNPDGSAVNPVAFQRHLQNDQNLMQRLSLVSLL
jgi:hypothetical protein